MTFLAGTNVYPQVLSLLSAQAGHFYDAVHIHPESQIWVVVREGTRNCLVGITHNTGSKINSCSSSGSCKAQQGVIFDTGNLVRMMLFFTKPKRQFLWVNKDSAEAAAFGSENATWECFFLGRSCVETQHSKKKKYNWVCVCARVVVRQCVLGRASGFRRGYTNPPLALFYLPLETTWADTNLSL